MLTTSTLNRVMVVELALPAMLPGALVAFTTPFRCSARAWGFGSDLGARRTPWIVGGMAVLRPGGLWRCGGDGVDGRRSRWPASRLRCSLSC